MSNCNGRSYLQILPGSLHLLLLVRASFSWSMVCLRHLCTVLNYSFIDKDDRVLTYGGYSTQNNILILSMSAFIRLGTTPNFDHVSVIDYYSATLKRINRLFREHQYCLLQIM